MIWKRVSWNRLVDCTLSKNALRYSLKAPLNKGDTETQTYGCRANNPDICKNCYVEGICAFVTNDSICMAPSAKWKKYYYELKDIIND